MNGGVYSATVFYFNESGWADSNCRSPRPERGAITGLRYTPNKKYPAFQSGMQRCKKMFRVKYQFNEGSTGKFAMIA